MNGKIQYELSGTTNRGNGYCRPTLHKTMTHKKRIEATKDIQSTPDKIISAFTDPVMLRDWCGVERTLIEKKVVGLYTLSRNITDIAIGFVSTGIINDDSPENIVVIDNFVYPNPTRPFLGSITLTITASMKAIFQNYTFARTAIMTERIGNN